MYANDIHNSSCSEDAVIRVHKISGVYSSLKDVPACIAQLVRALDLKTRGCGFDNLKIIDCLSDETLNRDPV